MANLCPISSKDRAQNCFADIRCTEPETKDRMCKGIAKFYVKIAHLYAAILKTINPLYIYKDKYGKEHHFSLLNKEKIPKNADVKLSEINLCTRRINALQFTTEGDNLKINISKACNINKKDSKYSFGTNPDEPELWGSSKTRSATLGEDVGIPELEKLYYDKYDYVHGKFWLCRLPVANSIKRT